MQPFNSIFFGQFSWSGADFWAKCESESRVLVAPLFWPSFASFHHDLIVI
jgi:Dcp2, box A domain